jgi:2',3'-cyclic-nucleotide 2'-phosphodiesterase (5'-nucleotidase family)
MRANRWTVPGIVLVLVSMAAGLSVSQPSAGTQKAGSTGSAVTVLYLSDTRGKLERCGCKGKQRGGVARRATYLNSVWSEGVATLSLEGGDLFGKRSHREQQETEFLCEQTAAFGVDAIGLGEADLNYGLPFLRKMIETYKLPFTNANVRDPKTGELILPEYLVVTKNGIRFGIVSVMDPGQQIITMNPADPEFRVDDPVATLRQVLPRLRKLCDTVVLLAHTGEPMAENLLNDVAGIDIEVMGHTFKNLETEQITHDALVLASVYEGRYIGRADLRIDPARGKVKAAKVTVTGLDETVVDDPVMTDKVVAFKAKLDQAKAELRAKIPRDLGAAGEEYLSSVNCRSCHEATYASWHDTGHAKAYESLRPKNMEYEPECLVCHTTGYRYAGGYEEDSDKHSLANVQCEACHGYGTQHARSGKWLKSARESCTECHDDANRPCRDQTPGRQFNYAEYWAKVKH